MTPKEKAMEYVNLNSYDGGGFLIIPDVEKAIDIALEEQHHQIFQWQNLLQFELFLLPNSQLILSSLLLPS